MAKILRPRKKTVHPIFNIVQVIKTDRCGDRWVMQAINPTSAGQPSEGQYMLMNGRVYCPKERGEKVLVRYTSMFEENL